MQQCQNEVWTQRVFRSLSCRPVCSQVCVRSILPAEITIFNRLTFVYDNHTIMHACMYFHTYTCIVYTQPHGTSVDYYYCMMH
jgi:hypothetical protein